MNYGKQVIEKLHNQLSRTAAGVEIISSHKINDLEFSFAVADHDKFSFILLHLNIANKQQQKKLSVSALQKRAELLKENITYLSEQLEVGEVDNENCRLLLRSKVPEDNSLPFAYFELTLDGSPGVALARFKYNKIGEPREKISFHLTEKTLTRLINNFVEAVSF